MKLYVRKRQFILSTLFPIIYLAINMVANSDHYVENFMMAVFMSLVLLIGYDYHNSLFSINNIFISVFYLLGVFLRYSINLLIPDTFQDFSTIHLEDSSSLHIKTVLILILTFLFYRLGRLVKQRKVLRDYNEEKDVRYREIDEKSELELNNQILLIAGYFILWIIVYFYKIRYFSSAVSDSYNTFDYLITTLTLYIKFVAYYELFVFLTQKKYKALIIYLLYFVPEVMISLLNAWKSTVVLEIMAFFIMSQLCNVKIKPKTYIISGIGFIFVYYFVTVYRWFLIHGGVLDISLNSFVSYLKADFFVQVSDRFQIYDLLYYTFNAPETMLSYVRNNTPTILSAFVKSIIPRVLWPGKGVVNNLSIVIKQYFFGHVGVYSNSNVTYLGTAYISYGLFGSCIFSFLYGWLSEVLSLKNYSGYDCAKHVLLAIGVLQIYEGNIAGKVISLLLSLIITYFIRILCFKLVSST